MPTTEYLPYSGTHACADIDSTIDEVRTARGNEASLNARINANVSALNTEIATKANSSDVTAALALKADSSTVTSALAEKADADDTTAALATKASASVVDDIGAVVGVVAPEVAAARVDADGTTHTTLKERLDSDVKKSENAVNAAKESPYGVWNYVSDGKENTACIIYLAVGETVGSSYASTGNTYIEIPCQSGDVFEISAKANPSLGLWTFVDDERTVLSKNEYGAVDTTNNAIRVVAPENADKLLVNYIASYGGYVVKYGDEILKYFNVAEESDAAINGVENEYTISAKGAQKFEVRLRKGVPYTYTNNTSASQSLVLYSGGTSKTLTQALASGTSRLFIPDAEYDHIGGYFNGTGTATLISNSLVDTDISVKESLINNIIFEQGGIDVSGAKVSNTKRLRTVSKLYGSFDLYLPDGFLIVSIAYYNNDDNTFDSIIQPSNASFWRVEGKTDKYVQIAIKKSDDSIVSVTDLKISDSLEDTNNKSTLAWINSTVFEQGSIYSTGADAESLERIRTRYMISGKQTYSLPSGFLFAKIVYYNSDGSFYSVNDLNTSVYTVTDASHQYRFVVKNASSTNITVRDFKGIQTLETLQKSIDFENTPAMVEFEIDHILPDTEDISNDLDGLNFNATNIVENILSKWDELAEEYPEYITREDAAELLELTYPAYATYNTYVYKLAESGQYINGSTTRRRKALLIGNLHGDEVCSPFVLYRIAKRLCECKDINAMKMRAAYDIYIIPSINEYGSVHKTRTNGNGVDINRNFPTKSWHEGGSGTDRYTGPYAGSEFETQIIMGLTDLFKCDICIDFHNYVSLDWQFYSETATKELLPISYKCLVDMSYSFIKNMPNYFGTNYKLFIDSNASAPKTYIDSAYYPGRNVVWWREEKGIVSATIEMSANINYMNGYISHQQNYTADAFAVGEYTYWVQLLKYAEYALKFSK